MKNFKNKQTKKRFLVIPLFILLVGALILTLELTGVTDFYQKEPTNEIEDTSEPQESINFNPPTEEEKNRGDSKKEEIVNEQEQIEQDDQTNKKQVKPVITSAGQFGDQIEVRGFIPGIYENTGACTITLMQNDVTIVRQVEGLQDATTTRCDTVNILRSDMPSAGTWRVNIEYSSPTSQGVSDETTFEVN